MAPIMYLDYKYYGVGVAMKPDGTVPRLARQYAWGEAESVARDEAAVVATAAGKAVRFGSMAKSCKEQFDDGDFPQIDFVNPKGGYLELERILDGASEAEGVPYALHFCRAATLEGMQKFWSKLFTARGYSRVSAHGDTWHTLTCFLP